MKTEPGFGGAVPRRMTRVASVVAAALLAFYAGTAVSAGLAQQGTDEPAATTTTARTATDTTATEPAATDTTTTEDTTTDTTRDRTTGTDTDNGTDNGTDLGTRDADTGASGELQTMDLDVDMRLRRATVELVDLNDDEEEYIRVTFTNPIQNFDDANSSLFYIQGFDPEDRVTASSIRQVKGDSSSLLVGFDSGTDLLSYAITGVEAGAVEETDGDANIPTTIRLDDTNKSGLTTAPELTEVLVDPSLDRIEYEFDRFLDEGQAGDSSAFGYYTSSGQSVTGTDIVSLDKNRVIVQFDSQVKNAERHFVDAGAVTNRQGTENVLSASGGRTAAPDLTRVRKESDTVWLYTFDEPISDPDPANFLLYSSSGESYAGDTAVLRSPRLVQVSFQEVRDFADRITVAAVAEGAATNLGTDDISNTIGSQSIAGARTGLTAGPDLIGVSRQAEAGEVTFSFDTDIDEDAAVDAGMFHVITDSGEMIGGDEVITIDEDEQLVKVLFPKTIVKSAVAMVVDSGAVVDLEGNANVQTTRALSGRGREAVLGEIRGPGATVGVEIVGRLGGVGCTQVDLECR